MAGQSTPFILSEVEGRLSDVAASVDGRVGALKLIRHYTSMSMKAASCACQMRCKRLEKYEKCVQEWRNW